MNGHDAERREPPLADDEPDFRDVIVGADGMDIIEFTDLPRRHRSAIADIRAYLRLLEVVTAWNEDEVKERLGCNTNVRKLKRLELQTLDESRDFLSLVCELALSVGEEEFTFAQQALELGVKLYAASDREIAQARIAVEPNDDFAVLQLLRDHHIDKAIECAMKAVEEPYLRSTTLSGRDILLRHGAVDDFANLLLTGPISVDER